jgi:hypothetical protein
LHEFVTNPSTPISRIGATTIQVSLMTFPPAASIAAK